MKPQCATAPVCAVGAIVFKEGSVLLVQRGKAPAYGKWSIPGGAVQLGETLEEALLREIKEETRLEIRPLRIAKVINRIIKDQNGEIEYHFVIIDYLCEVLQGQPMPGSDALAVGYFAIEQLDSLEMTDGTADVIREVYPLSIADCGFKECQFRS